MSCNCRHIDRYALGKAGEDVACTYLTSLGYLVISRREKLAYYEIDIVAKFREKYLFVEVKTVSETSPISAVEEYSRIKSGRFKKAVFHYLDKYKLHTPWSADLVCVTISDRRHWVEHYKDVFSGY